MAEVTENKKAHKKRQSGRKAEKRKKAEKKKKGAVDNEEVRVFGGEEDHSRYLR